MLWQCHAGGMVVVVSLPTHRLALNWSSRSNLIWNQHWMVISPAAICAAHPVMDQCFADCVHRTGCEWTKIEVFALYFLRRLCILQRLHTFPTELKTVHSIWIFVGWIYKLLKKIIIVALFSCELNVVEIFNVRFSWEREWMRKINEQHWTRQVVPYLIELLSRWNAIHRVVSANGRDAYCICTWQNETRLRSWRSYAPTVRFARLQTE